MQNIPSSGPVECVVRVYVIRAFDLQPNDPGGSVSSDLLYFFTCVLTESYE